MPIRPSTKAKGVYVEFDPERLERLRALAERNCRTFREEVEHAVQRHLDAPPVIKVVRTEETPELLPAEVGVREGQRPRRGRPRKAK